MKISFLWFTEIHDLNLFEEWVLDSNTSFYAMSKIAKQ